MNFWLNLNLRARLVYFGRWQNSYLIRSYYSAHDDVSNKTHARGYRLIEVNFSIEYESYPQWTRRPGDLPPQHHASAFKAIITDFFFSVILGEIVKIIHVVRVSPYNKI